MATRVIPQIRSSVINAMGQPSSSLLVFSTLKHGQSAATLGSSGSTLSRGSASRKEIFSFSTTTDKSQLFPTAALLQRNLICPALRSVITHPHCGSLFWSTQASKSLRYNSSGVYANISQRFGKQRRNRGAMKGASGNNICFGNYGLQVLEPAWISSKQILAGQLAIKRNMKGGKLVMRIFPHKPISLKPAETRMGRGKGSVAYWAAGVRAGRILYEIKGVPENVARKAISVAASKFPVRTRFVRS